MDKVCELPFTKVEIDDAGDVFFCCALKISNISIGNILREDFSSVWNSEKAKKIRELALKGDYTFCNNSTCHRLNNYDLNFTYVENSYKPIMTNGPIHVEFPAGKDCNAKCIFCRDKIIISNNNDLKMLNKKIYERYEPFFHNAKYISLNNQGEFLHSQTNKNLIKYIIDKYPNIKFLFITNGILATEKNFKELGIEDKIREISISINSVKEKTHNKIFRANKNSYKSLIKNLNYLHRLKLLGKIEQLNFSFVVNKYNWMEMKDFIKFSKKYNAQASFWEVRKYTKEMLKNSYEDLAVHLPSNKDYKKFKKYLLDPIFESSEISISGPIYELRQLALQEEKNRLSIFKRFSFKHKS